MTIKEMSYEECREDFFVKLIKHAENKIKHWKRQKGYRCEIEENLANAGAEILYCQDALKALEKQIPKKPKIFAFEYCCHSCHTTLNARKKSKYCDYCGQAIDWGEEE